MQTNNNHNGEKLVEVDNLVKYFPVRAGLLQRVVNQVKAVDDISFFVKKGETLGLVGESGCGKSVTSLSIMRLISKPGNIDEGQILLDGEDLLKSGASRLNEQAHAKLAQALEAAKATGVKLKDKALQGARSTDETIREYPYQSLGVAFGIGVLIGVLVHRR